MRGCDECWPWIAATADGYGVISTPELPSTRAHRVAFVIEHGRQPIGLVLHNCDNRPCCNHRHLWEGDNLDNQRDKIKKGRQAKGEGHGVAKLTAAQIRLIRDDPRLQREIAQDYGVTQPTIGYIKRRETWSHVR